LNIPIRSDGELYSFHALYPDQQKIVAQVLNKIKEWMECSDLSSFKPLRMTITGAGGSGKSVVINTIVSMLRNMFETNDVVKVVAPTGTAAFNVGGETFHHLCNNKVTRAHYKPNTMSTEKRKELVRKFKSLLCLIVDERSLINSCDLGTVECQIAETIFGGGFMSDESFGGLPVVLLVGDDYQLPGTQEGAFYALLRKGGSGMTRKGRQVLLECADFVMELEGSKRMKDNKIHQKIILERLRLREELSDQQVEKLLSLHLDVIRELHSTAVVNEIKRKAVYLFYTNEKRIRHNLEQLVAFSSNDNPVAVLQPKCVGAVGGKGISRHFDSQPPDATMICVGCRVAIENRNFNPIWGLHNGACGIVKEIVFNKGKNPNNGDLPLYVVVEFPLYCGPIWDKDNPKVTNMHVQIPKKIDHQHLTY